MHGVPGLDGSMQVVPGVWMGGAIVDVWYGASRNTLSQGQLLR